MPVIDNRYLRWGINSSDKTYEFVSKRRSRHKTRIFASNGTDSGFGSLTVGQNKGKNPAELGGPVCAQENSSSALGWRSNQA
jgi:hypothetical protein